MPNNPGIIVNVTVSANTPPAPPTASYSSSSNQVQSTGTININPGITSIQFVPGNKWNLVFPWITFSAGAPLSISNLSTTQVTISDDDSGSGKAGTFSYTLYTSLGALDPEIINKPKP